MHALSPPRPISPARPASRLNPLRRPRAASASAAAKTHLANLERLLQKPVPTPPKSRISPIPIQDPNPNPFLNALNISSLFPRPSAAAGDDIMSPGSLTRLHRLLLSDSPSPRRSIASRWPLLHGSADWSGLLDPLHPDLRRELVRYGELVQSAYHAFHSDPSVPVSHPRPVPLPDRSYRVTRHLFATSSIELPQWLLPAAAPHRSNWIGYVAVADSDREITRSGRRDIVIALRGTSTCLEWAENLRTDLVPIETNKKITATTTKPLSQFFSTVREKADRKNNKIPKVEHGFWSLYKTPGTRIPSMSATVVDEVRKLMEQYRGEELSITVTGHSLGAALAVLVADEISTCAPHVPPVAVISFGGPRVGNHAFVDRVERRGVKVLRVVNAHDVITRVPFDGYSHVGRELRLDSRISPYLRPNADPACCHDLEAYLHLVDGFIASNCPFRSNAKRSLVRLLNQQGANVKQKYVSRARKFGVDPVDPAAPVRSGVTGCLPSPS